MFSNLNALHFIEYDGLEEGFNLGSPKDDAETVGRRLNKLPLRSIVEGRSPKKPVPVKKVRSELDTSLPNAVEILLEKSTKLDSIDNQISSLTEDKTFLEIISSLGLEVELLSGYDNISSFVGTIIDLEPLKNIDYHNLLF